MAQSFLFTGDGTYRYPDYVDLDTDRMLVADPGRAYRMRATSAGVAVPPTDGRWLDTPQSDEQPDDQPTAEPDTAEPEPAAPSSKRGGKAAPTSKAGA